MTELGFCAGNETAAMALILAGDLPDLDPRVTVEVVGKGSTALWQTTTAQGWGHLDAAARKASDAFASAASEPLSPGLLLARSAADGRILGCATLSLRGDLATLAGMSTLPTERGQGVQRALVAHRLRFAADAGCELAVAQADPGSQS